MKSLVSWYELSIKAITVKPEPFSHKTNENNQSTATLRGKNPPPPHTHTPHFQWHAHMLHSCLKLNRFLPSFWQLLWRSEHYPEAWSLKYISESSLGISQSYWNTGKLFASLSALHSPFVQSFINISFIYVIISFYSILIKSHLFCLLSPCVPSCNVAEEFYTEWEIKRSVTKQTCSFMMYSCSMMWHFIDKMSQTGIVFDIALSFELD